MNKYIFADTETTYTPESKKDHMCTVYFPNDCLNNCKFCTSKTFYSQNKPNPEKVLNIMKTFANSLLTEIVITGGEPSSNIAMLKEMLVISNNKNVFINTTLPASNAEDFVNLINSFDCVKGVNISRHCGTIDKDSLIIMNPAPDETILKIKTNVRINCFVGAKISKEKMSAIIERWTPIWRQKENHSLDISFRHDYNNLTVANIHDLNTPSIYAATEIANYYGRVYCHVCDKVLFKTKEGMDFRIHRGLAKTRIKIGNITEMQELVLFPDGELCTDWDKTKDGLYSYCKQLNIKINKNLLGGLKS